MISTDPQQYRFAFIGLGCANSLVVLELHSRGLLSKSRIVVIEPSQKTENDRREFIDGPLFDGFTVAGVVGVVLVGDGAAAAGAVELHEAGFHHLEEADLVLWRNERLVGRPLGIYLASDFLMRDFHFLGSPSQRARSRAVSGASAKAY